MVWNGLVWNEGGKVILDEALDVSICASATRGRLALCAVRGGKGGRHS